MPSKISLTPSCCEDYFATDQLKSNLRIGALRGAGITFVFQGAAFCIQTIGTIIMARLLTPHDFGLVAMVLTVSMLLGNVGVNGFTEAIIQKKDINHRQISTLFWINVGLSIVLAVLFIASTPVIIWFYNEPRLQAVIIVIAVSNVVAGLSVQHQALLKRNMLFYKSSVNELVAGFASAAIPIALALWGWGYWALVAKWVIYPAAISAGAWLMCGWRPGLPSKNSDVEPMLKFAFHTYGNFAMSYFRRNMDKILIGRYWGSQTLGYYDRAYQFSNMLPVQVINPLFNVAISAFSRLSDDSARFRNAYLKVLSILAFIAMPLSAVLTVMSHDLMLLILGPQWEKAGPVFFAFGISIGLSILYVTHGWLHLSLGTPDRWFLWSIIEFIVTVLCIIIGLPYGAEGVAFAFSASVYILTVPALWYAGKPIQLTLYSIASTTWKYFVSAAVAGLASWFFLFSNAYTSDLFLKLHILNRLSVAAILCFSLYLSGILLLFRSMQPIEEFFSMLGEIIKTRSSEKQ